MGYVSVLTTLKIYHKAHINAKDEDEPDIPKVPKMNDRDNDVNVILWVPMFK